MSYTLVGSYTSPFVRRIRMLMETIPYEFMELNIYEAPGAKALHEMNPINQIPILILPQQKIWDSRQIFNFLNLKYQLFNLGWDDENDLTAIERGLDAGITLFLMKKSGIDIEADVMFINRQKERMESVLTYLKPLISKRYQEEWNFHTMTLYSFLDWAKFRGVLDVDSKPECLEFMKAHKDRSIVLHTQIPGNLS